MVWKRAGRASLVLTMILVVSFALPAGALPPGVKHEFTGHFTVGCIVTRDVCVEARHVFEVPEEWQGKVNYVDAFAMDGTRVFGALDLDICVLRLAFQRVCFDGFSLGWLPTLVTHVEVYLMTVGNGASIDVDYVVWLSCEADPFQHSPVNCTP